MDQRGGYRAGSRGSSEGFSNPHFGRNEFYGYRSNGPRYNRDNNRDYNREYNRDYNRDSYRDYNRDNRDSYREFRRDYNRDYNSEYRSRGPRYTYYSNQERNFDPNNNEDSEDMQKKEDEKNFKDKYNSFIEKINNAFYGQAKNEDILNIIRGLIQMPSLTIFEAMNFIYREIKIYYTLEYYRHKNDKSKSVDPDIFENKYPEEFPSPHLNNIIEKYKTNKYDEKNLNNSYELYAEENVDKRRDITKNKDDIYNYLPIKSIRNINEEDQKRFQELEIFSKTDNEIYFHPLFYKTLMCNSCEPEILMNINCPYSHDIQSDFRIIYDYKDNKICELMRDLSQSNLFSFQNYMIYIPMKMKFDKIDLLSFKVHKCQLDQSCPNDYHLCPYYHENKKANEQKRRPPLLFRYSSEMCEFCYDKKKGKYNVKKCPYGDFCNNIHSKNEYNYHQDNFGKQFQCTRNPKGKCPYFKTCYGVHNIDNIDDEDEESEEESIDEQTIDNEITNDTEISEQANKIEKLVRISKNLICRRCNNLKTEVCFFINCNHFICIHCFKKYEHELKKSNKEKNKDLKCPFCLKEIEKGKLIRYKFSRN